MSALPPHMHDLPAPDPADCERSRALVAQVLAEADRTGFVPFARFMELALYSPQLGYYASGAAKLGSGGDFVTAPEISGLFGRTLAAQIAQILEQGCDTVLELGAGSGVLAADILRELERRDRLPRSYRILEVSADLADRQRSRLGSLVPHLLDRIEWLQRLPARIEGVVLGNEVLDAMPVALVTTRDGTIYELGVTRGASGDTLAWDERPAQGPVLEAARTLELPDGYTTELHLAAQGLVRSLGDVLQRGIVLFVDYGFAAREYYHPQRARGTLMCHYRHRAHGDPLQLVGLQDITAHVDFSGLAAAAREAGLDVLGYTTQARFLIDCGILEILGGIPVDDAARYAKAAAGAQKLLQPSEMGELFKVIAFGRSIEAPLLGFRSRDRRSTL